LELQRRKNRISGSFHVFKNGEQPFYPFSPLAQRIQASHVTELVFDQLFRLGLPVLCVLHAQRDSQLVVISLFRLLPLVQALVPFHVQTVVRLKPKKPSQLNEENEYENLKRSDETYVWRLDVVDVINENAVGRFRLAELAVDAAS